MPSHSIKVSDEVYNELVAMLMPRESFSQVVERLLWTRRKVDALLGKIKDTPEYRKAMERQSESSQEDV